MPDIRVERLTKKFGAFVAVRELDITFPENTVTCLLGPSGCGKTTLLRMIAGLETPTSGRILFGEREVSQLPPRKRNIGMVFQYPVMYPTLSVAENIERPLLMDRGLSAVERRARIDEVLDILQMADLAQAFIGELDAGSRQKVAVGRAVARHCDILLFDEPTTNVEVNNKLQLIRAFKEVARRLKQSIVYVTHDQTEAMTLADQIALMRDGEIEQCEPPRALYNDPLTEFGGWFLGNPGMNFLRHEVSPDSGRIELPLFDRPLAMPEGAAPGEILTVGIRPEAIEAHAAAVPGAVAARVLNRSITIGGQLLLKLRVGEDTLKVKSDPERLAGHGDQVYLSCPLEAVIFFRHGRRISHAAAFAD